MAGVFKLSDTAAPKIIQNATPTIVGIDSVRNSGRNVALSGV
jgi:hypothetical protein